MRDMFYNELRDCVSRFNDSRNSVSDANPNVMNERISDSVIQILDMSMIVRKRDILDLEEKLNDLTGPGTDYLKCILMDIIDGCDAESIEEMAFLRYCSNVFDNCERLQYLIYLKGALLMQQGANSYLVEKTLKCMLPKEIQEVLDKRIEEWAKKETGTELLEKLYNKDLAVTPKEKDYERVKLADIVIQRLDYKAIRRVLRDVDNIDLALMLKILSGGSNKAVLSNLSDRLAFMIAEDMDHISPVRLSDAIKATDKVMSIICKLIQSGEIVAYECDVIPDLEKYFRIKNDPEKEEETALVESELRTLFEEYARKDPKVIY